MILSVFVRHSTHCRFKRDRLYRRCSCPKWIGGQVNKDFFRVSASTRIWEEAETRRAALEDALDKGLPPFGPDPQADATASAAVPDSLPIEPTGADAPETDSPTHELKIKAPAGQIDKSQPLADEVMSLGRRRPRVTVMHAVSAYMLDARSRALQPASLGKLERLFEKQFLPWTQAEGLHFLDEVDLDALLAFRGTWDCCALVKAKRQDTLVGFFWSCFRRNYINQNPALSMSKIRPKQVPTDYFPRPEFEQIIAATHTYGHPHRGEIPVEDNRARLRALTLLMRWSGLRIRDAVTLERHRLQADNLLLYQAKTGTPVYVPLPPYLVRDLNSLPPGPKPNPRYFFWSGNGLVKSVVTDWQRSYAKLFKIANIRKADGTRKRCHPHMFRDTFAVENLLAGIPIDQVSLLLGHSSVKITERHYSPFVRARQLQLQKSVREAWKVNDFLSGYSGPSEVHGIAPR